MNPELERLIKGLLASIALIGGGYYIKIAKNKEPYATKSLWKITIIVGIATLVISIILYFSKT